MKMDCIERDQVKDVVTRHVMTDHIISGHDQLG